MVYKNGDFIEYITIPKVGDSINIRKGYIVNFSEYSLIFDPAVFLLKDYIGRLKKGLHYSNRCIQIAINEYIKIKHNLIEITSTHDLISVCDSKHNFPTFCPTDVTFYNFIINRYDNKEEILNFIVRLNSCIFNSSSVYVILENYFL